MSIENVLPPSFTSRYFTDGFKFPQYQAPDFSNIATDANPLIEARKKLAQQLGYTSPETDPAKLLTSNKALLDELLTKPKTKEQLLAEQQAFFGDDTQKDAEIQGALALAKYGSQVAQTPGSLLQALVAPAGTLAADLSQVAASKSAVERAAKEKAFQAEIDQTEQRRKQDFDLAFDAIKTAQVNENTRASKIQEIIKDVIKEVRADTITETALINQRIDKEVAAHLSFAAEEDSLYAKLNPDTGKYDIIRARPSAQGPKKLNETTQELEDIPEGYLPISKSDISDYISTGAVDLSDAKQVQLVVPDANSPLGWVQKLGIYSPNAGGYRLVPDDGDITKSTSLPAGTVVGDIKDVISKTQKDKAGRVFVTVKNPANGSTYTYLDSVQVVDENGNLVDKKLGDNLAFDIKPAKYETVVVDGKQVRQFVEGNPLASFVDGSGVTFQNLSERELNNVVNKARYHVNTLYGAQEILDQLENVIGPIGTLKTFASARLSAFLPDDVVAKLGTYFGEQGKGVQSLKNFGRTILLTELLSDKNAVTEQQIVNDLIPKLDFAKNPRFALQELQSYIRGVYNRLAETRYVLEPDKYDGKVVRLEAAPAGTADDPFVFYDSSSVGNETRHFDFLVQQASSAKNPLNVEGLKVKFTGQQLEFLLKDSDDPNKIGLYKNSDGSYKPSILLDAQRTLDLFSPPDVPGDQSKVDENIIEKNKEETQKELETQTDIQISDVFPKNLRENLKKPENIDALVRTIVAEAGGESDEGQLAVANVILNRFKDKRYPNDIKRIVLQPYQFSAYNSKDEGGNDLVNVSPNNPTYKKVKNIVELLLAGTLSDNTGGATHYWNPSLVNPSWGNSELAVHKNRGKKIGRHLFAGSIRT